MRNRVIALTVAALAFAVTSAPALAGISTSPGAKQRTVSQEMDHG
jgi:hypothetical protein